MRIAILSYVFSKEFGVARVIAAQLPWLLEAGMEVDVFACDVRNTVDAKGVRVIRVPTHLRGMKRALESGGYDVVIAHTHPFYHLLASLRGCKTLLYEHGMPPIDRFPVEEQEARRRMVADMPDRVYPAVDKVVTISRYASRYIGWEQAAVIPNGADHYMPLAREGVEPSGPLTLLCVSRYGTGEQRYKGLDLLGRLSQDLGCRVVLVGRGPDAERRKLQAQGLEVVAFENDVQLVDLYQRCDALVSFSQWETFNLPLGEAEFFGKPALALDIGPHGEVTPLVFPDYESVRDFLQNSTRESLKAEGEKCRAFAQARFSWKKNGEALVHLIHEIAPNPLHRRPGLYWHLACAFWRARQWVRLHSQAWRRA